MRLMTITPSSIPPAPRPPTSGLTRPQILGIVSGYIGGTGGFLSGFTHPTLEAFYPVHCDLEIDPQAFGGQTTREQFIAVLEGIPPAQQASVIRGVIRTCAVGEA